MVDCLLVLDDQVPLGNGYLVGHRDVHQQVHAGDRQQPETHSPTEEMAEREADTNVEEQASPTISTDNRVASRPS